jgi:predicted ArsR family transcriptional regulator
MKAEKGKTIQYIRNIRTISQQSRDQLKTYNKVKKDILGALKKSDEMTIPEIAEKLNMPTHSVVYYLMSLLKYGMVETTRLDDMDEYYYYKLKSNGKN